MFREITIPDRQSSPGPLVIGRAERSCVINGVALVVTPGDGVRERKYVALSVTALRSVNHYYPGLLYEVSDDADRDAAQYPIACRCAAGLPLTVAAD